MYYNVFFFLHLLSEKESQSSNENLSRNEEAINQAEQEEDDGKLSKESVIIMTSIVASVLSMFLFVIILCRVEIDNKC